MGFIKWKRSTDSYIRMKQYNVRELQQLLRKNDYVCQRTTGSHEIWNTGSTTIVLPVVNLKYKIAVKIAKQILGNGACLD